MTRVVHLITRMIIGGAQENTMLTAAMLDRSEFEVSIISGSQTGPEGSLIEEVRARGVPLAVEHALVRQVSPIRDLVALLRLAKRLRKGNYTIAHTHSSKAGILGRWAARLAGVSIIVHTVHGWGHHERQHSLVRAIYIGLERLTVLITDRLVAVSQLDVEKGLQAGIGKREDYVVIRSGIELDRFGHSEVTRQEIRAQLGVPIDAPVVGSVTRLSPQKAPLDFVHAASLVLDKVPDAWFIVVGDGPLREEVERLTAALGISGRLILTGLRRDIPAMMAAFDVFCLTSLWEGLPRVIPQAMATGLPVVATAADGNAEAVVQGVTGLLVPPSDVQALAEAAITLLLDPKTAGRMGHAGRTRAAEFDAGKMVDDIANLYRCLLSNSRAGFQ